jgi:transposase
VFRVCVEPRGSQSTEEQLSKEGYRLLWFHSQSKADSDAATRARRLQRAIRELTDLRGRLRGPRTRFKERPQVTAAVDAILDAQAARDLLVVDIQEVRDETYRQAGRGRPSKDTKYQRQVKTRFDVSWQLDAKQLEIAAAADGVFPLITNLLDWKPEEVLQAYKRQPTIEKRFSQLKSDFRVAPVYLKSVQRIVGLLAVYFFALMVQSLLERDLRQAMEDNGTQSLPLYPEGRPCRRPTTRQVLDTFEPLARHSLGKSGSDEFEIFTTELAPIHCSILKLLRIPTSDYRTA